MNNMNPIAQAAAAAAAAARGSRGAGGGGGSSNAAAEPVQPVITRAGIVAASTAAAALLALLGPAIVALLFASSSSPLRFFRATARDDGDMGEERSGGGGGANVGKMVGGGGDHRRPQPKKHDGNPVDGLDDDDEGRDGGWVVPFFYSPPPPRDDDEAATDDDGTNDNEPPFRDLRRALGGYGADTQSALRALGRAESVARESERLLFGGSGDGGGPIAAALRERRGRLAEVLEADGFALEGLLRPFPVVIALPDGGGGGGAGAGAGADPGGHRDDEGVELMGSNDDAGLGGSLRSVEDGGGHPGPGGGGGVGEFVLKYRSSPFRQAGGGDGAETPADYDSAASVLSHVARDWSDVGRSARASTYDWCIWKLEIHLPLYLGELTTTGEKRAVNVLVPGAGLARLARDMALAGYTVEANDRSVVMAAAAHAILHGTEGGRGVIHPFAIEPFSNEVDSSLRYEAVRFPDEGRGGGGRSGSGGCTTGRDSASEPSSALPTSCCCPRSHPRSRAPERGSMSYTVGDFVSTYASPERRGTFDAVVTCFFLDTAASVFEYIAAIRNVLRRPPAPDDGEDADEDEGESSSRRARARGGLWINVGPLQWHRDALVRPSANELRSLIDASGDFDVLEWSFDHEVVSYGHDGDAGGGGGGGGRAGGGGGSKPRSTRFEGYRPLRFVAALRGERAGGGRAGTRTGDAMSDVLAVRRAIDTMTTFGKGRSKDHRGGGGRGDDAAWGGQREHYGGDDDGDSTEAMPEGSMDPPPPSSLLGELPRVELILEDDDHDEDLDQDYDLVDDADLISPDVN